MPDAKTQLPHDYDRNPTDVILDLIARARERGWWTDDEVPTGLPSSLDITLYQMPDSPSLPDWLAGKGSLTLSLDDDDEGNTPEASADTAAVATLCGDRRLTCTTKDEIDAALWDGVDAAVRALGYRLARTTVTTFALGQDTTEDTTEERAYVLGDYSQSLDDDDEETPA